MKKLIFILLFIPIIGFSETNKNNFSDSYFNYTDCKEVEENYFRCSKEGISFYGMFIEGVQEGLGVYKQVANNTSIYFIAEHQNGKVNGDGKTIIKIDDDWSREFILSYYEYDYPLDMFNMFSNSIESITSGGVFYDTYYNYYIFGSFDYARFFLEENNYLLMYLDESETNNIPLSYISCIYNAKIDTNSLSKLIIKPKDGLATIGCSDKNTNIASRYIGNIKNMTPNGKGFKELNYTQRDASTLDIPPLEYFDDINDITKYETGDFSNGILVAANTDFLKNSEQYISFEKKTFSTGFYLFSGENKLKFNEKYENILSDIEGYISLFE